MRLWISSKETAEFNLTQICQMGSNNAAEDQVQVYLFSIYAKSNSYEGRRRVLKRNECLKSCSRMGGLNVVM